MHACRGLVKDLSRTEILLVRTGSLPMRLYILVWQLGHSPSTTPDLLSSLQQQCVQSFSKQGLLGLWPLLPCRLEQTQQHCFSCYCHLVISLQVTKISTCVLHKIEIKIDDYYFFPSRKNLKNLKIKEKNIALHLPSICIYHKLWNFKKIP